MALSKKQKLILDEAMGSKAAADRLVAAIAADATLDKKAKRELEIAIADKKAADDIAAAIDAASGSISDRSYRALKNMMITKDAAAQLKSDIES